MRCINLVGLLLLAFALDANAQTLVSEAEGYSLEFPGGWTATGDGKKFSAKHADGSSFEGFRKDVPSNVDSVEVVALMTRADALAAGLCSGKGSEFALSGKGWAGSGFHCNNKSPKGKPKSQAIGFTAKRGDVFHQFMLFVPRQDWESNRQHYLELFQSLAFR